MKPARILVICVAAVAAIGLALVVRAMGSSGKPVPAASAEQVEAKPMAKVLVASRELKPGERLTEADLDWKDWPVDTVNPAYITDGSVPIPAPPTAKEAEDAVEKAGPADKPAKPGGAVAAVTRAAGEIVGAGSKSDFVGSVVRETILAGEPILPRKIVRAGDSGYMAAYLEPGMRAMAIRVSVETAAGGFILPGDRVDVVLTRQTNLNNIGNATQDSKFASATVMRNLKVLAIDQTTQAADDEHAVVGATATLEVGPGDAEALALAKSEGELSLILRSYADTAGPSGRVAAPPRQNTVVRVYRGGEPDTVVVQ